MLATKVGIWSDQRIRNAGFFWLCKELMILIYIASLEHISCKYFWNEQNNSHYIEAFGAAHWAKKAVKNILDNPPPSEDEGIIRQNRKYFNQGPAFATQNKTIPTTTTSNITHSLSVENTTESYWGIFVTRPPKGVATPFLDILYRTPDTPIFATSV